MSSIPSHPKIAKEPKPVSLSVFVAKKFVSYKINKRRVSHTIAFEGLNVFNGKAQTMQRFDLATQQVCTYEGSISLPNVFYRLDF